MARQRNQPNHVRTVGVIATTLAATAATTGVVYGIYRWLRRGDEPEIQIVWRYVVVDSTGAPGNVPPFQGVASPEGDMETQIVSSVHPTFEMAQHDIEQIIRDRGGFPEFVPS